jgi:hypothetical protein
MATGMIAASQRANFHEGAGVKQAMDSFSRGQATPRALLFEFFGTAHCLGARLPVLQLVQ